MSEENKNQVEVEVNGIEQEKKQESGEYVIVFTKPYKFEGKQYDQVDLSEMENLSTYQLIDCEKEFMADNNYINLLSETTTALGCIIASRVTNLPINFFHQLPANEGNKIKQMVMGFFYQ